MGQHCFYERFYWITATSGITPDHFVLAHNSENPAIVELWVKIVSTYEFYSFTILSSSTRTKIDNNWVLSDVKTTAITEGYTQLKSTLVNIKNNAATATKLATARKIGSASFNGSADITLKDIGASELNHTHDNYASSVKTAGNGNAVTSITQSGNTITANKDSTFLTKFRLERTDGVVYRKFAVYNDKTVVGAGISSGQFLFSQMGGFGTNVQGLSLVSISTRGSVGLNVLRIQQGVDELKIGYVENVENKAIEFWVKQFTWSYETMVIPIGGSYNAKEVGILETTTTEPEGITYVTPINVLKSSGGTVNGSMTFTENVKAKVLYEDSKLLSDKYALIEHTHDNYAIYPVDTLPDTAVNGRVYLVKDKGIYVGKNDTFVKYY